MAERVRFHFDPICPWAYQTSRWARRLAELGEIELDWGVFSLEIANEGREESKRKGHRRSEPALRTVVCVRDHAGADGVGAFYATLGARVHEQSAALDDEGVITDALRDAGLDPQLLEKALGDAGTWDTVVAEHRALVERTRSFGVPTVVLDGGDGPAIFGPVVSAVPTDEDAVQLWRCVSWLARYGNFSELKRDRTDPPDLESFRRFRAAQEERG